jgi:hypothetical protein
MNTRQRDPSLGGEITLEWRFARWFGLLVISGLLLDTRPARAVDEIQIYNAEIADVGQFTAQHHFNYAFSGRTEPDFPGGLIPNHALNATPEFAWGITKWFEFGLYFPWAIDGENRFLSNGAKLRTLFVVPDAAKRNFFFGINFEYDFTTPPFLQSRFAMEIRPIIGWRDHGLEFIVNPIFDVFGTPGHVDFLPAARLARNLNKDVAVGFEYYTDLGPIGSFPSFEQQSHQLFAVVDFKVGKLDIDFGVGRGLTAGSDRWVSKTFLTYHFPVVGQQDEKDAMQDDNSKMLKPPNMNSSLRQNSAIGARAIAGSR